MSKEYIGSNFDDFLNEEGLLAQAQAVARVFAWEVSRYLQESKQTEKKGTERLINDQQ